MSSTDIAVPVPSYSGEEQVAWARRIHHVQHNQLNPEQKQQLVQRSEQARTTRSYEKSCKKMKVKSHRMQQVAWSGMTALSAHSSDAVSAPNQAYHQQQYAVIAQGFSAQMGVAPAQIDADEEVERVLEAVPDIVSTNEMDDLLRELRVEPKTDEENTAKFLLYEKFHEKVEKIRIDLFEFWSTTGTTLPQAVRQTFDRKLRDLDGEQNMGIPDATREWFVFHMVKQVDRNITYMENVLKEMQDKLRLLANMQQDECPICLEKFNPARQPEVLGCCHALCHECWNHWRQLRGGGAFCPLCRHIEFVEALQEHV